MTNKCDLDEMKHIAQQKFIELVESGVEFEWDVFEWCYGRWEFWADRLSANEYLVNASVRNVNFLSGVFKRGENLAADAAIVAFHRSERRREAKRQEASCKALQEALKNTATTLATSTYKEHTEAPVQSEGHPDTPSVGEWFVIRYGGSEMEVCILEVQDDAVKWGMPRWLVSSGIWSKTWEFREKVRVSLGTGKPRRWGWWRLTSRDLFFPYSRPKP